MILAVDEVGYADAVEAFRSANHAAASLTSRLAADLAATGAMAGTDSGAEEFAAAYDGAAGETVAGLGDAARALDTVGRTTAACDTRHRDSERAAIIPGAVVDPGCAPPPADSWLTPLPSTPPSSLGGDSPALSDQENWILDQVGGILWPDGSPERLRAAAAAWRRTAEALPGLASTCTVAGDALATQRSPEIPLALAATDELRAGLLSLADQCGSLATQCDAYATAIETAHAALRALLTEILMMVVEGMVVSAVLGAVSLGAGAAAGTAAIAVRIAAKAPRFHQILSVLRAARTGYTTAIRTTHTAAAAARARLARFLRVPARGERGAFQVVPGRFRRRTGWLDEQERAGGHVIKEHVGRSADDLAARAATSRGGRASTFANQEAAERFIGRALDRSPREIEEWLGSTRFKKVIDVEFGRPTGVTVVRDGSSESATGVRLVLYRDASMPDGYRVHTAFPN
ncbi:hypothetical protein GCM10009623_26880 [Nocardioides aestuarii]|uniref:RNase A-like domain-containing protein n=1 Tax=Nocardioides aestuarii TaxID=252231 RepID=A0ABW4TMB4_9ACTN